MARFSTKTMDVNTYRSRWIKRPEPRADAKMRLFCFPYAGGTASIFRTWSEHLPRSIELCSIQLPGREDRIHEPAFTNLSDLVHELVAVLEPLMDRPFAFYGHSMGTLIAFELARQLRREGLPGPDHLFVSGRCAPQVPDPDPQLHKLPRHEFIEGIRRYNGTPEAVLNNDQLMDLLVPLLRSDFTVCETYIYNDERPLECSISAFAGELEYCSSLIEGWKHQTDGQFDSSLFPGGHFFIQSGKAALLNAMSQRLERCNYVELETGEHR